VQSQSLQHGGAEGAEIGVVLRGAGRLAERLAGAPRVASLSLQAGQPRRQLRLGRIALQRFRQQRLGFVQALLFEQQTEQRQPGADMARILAENAAQHRHGVLDAPLIDQADGAPILVLGPLPGARHAHLLLDARIVCACRFGGRLLDRCGDRPCGVLFAFPALAGDGCGLAGPGRDIQFGGDFQLWRIGRGRRRFSLLCRQRRWRRARLFLGGDRLRLRRRNGHRRWRSDQGRRLGNGLQRDRRRGRDRRFLGIRQPPDTAQSRRQRTDLVRHARIPVERRPTRFEVLEHLVDEAHGPLLTTSARPASARLRYRGRPP
jgi:hypothetical protein